MRTIKSAVAMEGQQNLIHGQEHVTIDVHVRSIRFAISNALINFHIYFSLEEYNI
jgi:hypothetical protein